MNGDVLFRSCSIRLRLVLALMAAVLTGSAHAGGLIGATGSGTAIEGYDSVAYFTMDRAKYGSKDITYEWLGAKWRFVNAEHRDLFVADPFKYLPQYGGYCANIAKSGNFSRADPSVWRIVDGKLYLFSSRRAKGSWGPNQSGVAKGAARWEEKARATLL